MIIINFDRSKNLIKTKPKNEHKILRNIYKILGAKYCLHSYEIILTPNNYINYNILLQGNIEHNNYVVNCYIQKGYSALLLKTCKHMKKHVKTEIL